MITAVVLAAGAARRFGSQKLLAPLLGRPLVRWTVERVLASAVDQVLVVGGREGAGVRDALSGLAVDFVFNPHYADGLSSSLRAGVEALAPHADAALVVLGDQPGLEVEVVDRVVAAYRAGGRPIVAARYRGQPGHPVLFARPVFPELLEVRGDRGARAVIERDPCRVEWIDHAHAAPPDVDTPEEHAALVRTFGALRPSLAEGGRAASADTR